MYDITINGSIIDAADCDGDAMIKAACHSIAFTGRLVRVHGVDGVSVIAEYRDGEAEFIDLLAMSH
jgi:hypothetical protein